jgi:hypothetical protein
MFLNRKLQFFSQKKNRRRVNNSPFTKQRGKGRIKKKIETGRIKKKIEKGRIKKKDQKRSN